MKKAILKESVLKKIAYVTAFVMIVCIMPFGLNNTLAGAESTETVLADLKIENGVKQITADTGTDIRFETAGELKDNQIILTPASENTDGTYKITRNKGNIFIKTDSQSANNIAYHYGQNVNVFIDVTYCDSGYGWFYIRYRTQDKDENGNYIKGSYSNHKTEYVNMTNTGKDMTHRFVISGEPFSKSNFSDYGTVCDFELCTTDSWGNTTNTPARNRSWSKDSVYIKEVRVSYDKTAAPIKTDITSNNYGNIFSEDEDIVFDVSYLNTYTADKGDRSAYIYDKTFDVNYKVYKYDKNMSKQLLFNESLGTKKLSGEEKTSDKLLISVQDKGLYLLEAELIGDNGKTGGKIYQKYEVEFSKAAKNETLNKNLGASTHFSRDGYSKEGMDILTKAGLGLVREDAYWRDFEAEKGVYELTDLSKEFFGNLSKTDMECLLLIYANNALYDVGADPSSFPAETVIPNFKNYVTALLNKDEIKNNIDMLEIWNEPDIMSYQSKNNISDSAEKKGKAYANVLKAAYDAAQDVNAKSKTNYKVGAFCVCNLWGDPGTTFTDYALNNLNGEQKFDNIVMHPYTGVDDDFEIGTNGKLAYKGTDARESVVYRINKLKSLITGDTVYNYRSGQYEKIQGEETGNSYKFNAGNAVWHSEFGYSSANPYGNMSTGSDYIQAVLLMRGINLIRENNFDDKIWIYDLFNDGEQKGEEQHNYGLVNSLTAKTPMSAKYSYLAAANYNNLTADAISAKSVHGTKGDFEFVTEYSYKNTSKKTYMLWTTKDSAQLNFTISGNVKYYDLTGNRLDEKDVKTDGKYNLSPEPFYAVVNFEDESTDNISINLTDGIKLLNKSDISKIDFNKVKVVADPKSTDLSAVENAYIIIGLYDKDRLVNTVKYKWSQGETVENNIKSFDLTFAENYKNKIDNIKVFIWKDMLPLTKAYDNKS